MGDRTCFKKYSIYFLFVSFFIHPICFQADGKQLPSAIIKTEYDGPLNLKWGMPKETVDSILQLRLSFEDRFEEDGDSLFEYKGAFDNFSNSTIQAHFRNDSLFVISVAIPQQGEHPISMTWLTIVNKMKDRYGSPELIKPPPKGLSSSINTIKNNYPSTNNSDRIKVLLDNFSAGISDYEYWDQCILNGKWEPVSLWKFKNAGIWVIVILSDPDKNNFQKVTISWLFFHGKSIKKMV